jgi:hypothetical protein
MIDVPDGVEMLATRIGSAVAFGLVIAVAWTSIGSPAAGSRTSQQPSQGTQARGYSPPRPGEQAPELQMAGLSRTAERAARLRLAKHDAAVAAALTEADTAAAMRSTATGKVESVRPDLPRPAAQPQGLVESRPLLPYLPQSANQLLACSGNCYQSDHVLLTDHPNDVYAVDYYVWLAIPQSQETNRCDGSSQASGCFWFFAMTYYTDCSYCNAGIHIGPQRGDSLAGSAGANWRMNIDGYNNGSHVGGQSATNLPTATWIRVRTWRTSSGTDASAPYTPWATFGVWALWGGTDRYLGSVTIDGTTIANSNMFVEVYEQNGQCSTDIERGYLDNPMYQRNGAWYGFAHATANYEANCANTSWRVQGAPDYIRNERETTRTIANGATIW